MRLYQSHRIQRAIFFALLISLLLHFTIFISFLYNENNKQEYNKNQTAVTFEQEAKDKLAWAARKAHASQFGAPVIFQDLQEESMQNQTDHVTESAEQNTPKNQELTQATQEKSTEENNALEPTKNEIPEETSQKLETNISIPKQSSQTKQYRQQPISSSSTKKPPTLAQLTKGFLEHIKNEGKDQITTEGQEGITPTADQLKHERYIEKLSWCLQNSFKINRDKFPVTTPIKTMVKVYLALNKNGTVQELHIVESSGNQLLDRFTQFVFQDASSSFPPVPQYLPHNPYKVIYIIEINTIQDTRIGLHFV